MSNVPEPENILLLKTIANQGVLTWGTFSHMQQCPAIAGLTISGVLHYQLSRDTAAMSGRHIWYAAEPIADIQWLL